MLAPIRQHRLVNIDIDIGRSVHSTDREQPLLLREWREWASCALVPAIPVSCSHLIPIPSQICHSKSGHSDAALRLNPPPSRNTTALPPVAKQARPRNALGLHLVAIGNGTFFLFTVPFITPLIRLCRPRCLEIIVGTHKNNRLPRPRCFPPPHGFHPRPQRRQHP
jgi:hypothetical protein